jgi:hypothetical protein
MVSDREYCNYLLLIPTNDVVDITISIYDEDDEDDDNDNDDDDDNDIVDIFVNDVKNL